ncbi:MAG: hypothetical protein DDT40_00922 [candidate division WS2 bacterium]|nr:hypothetical protein [Candidatus Psychracetigena formicireducens]
MINIGETKIFNTLSQNYLAKAFIFSLSQAIVKGSESHASVKAPN